MHFFLIADCSAVPFQKLNIIFPLIIHILSFELRQTRKCLSHNKFCYCRFHSHCRFRCDGVVAVVFDVVVVGAVVDAVVFVAVVVAVVDFGISSLCNRFNHLVVVVVVVVPGEESYHQCYQSALYRVVVVRTVWNIRPKVASSTLGLGCGDGGGEGEGVVKGRMVVRQNRDFDKLPSSPSSNNFRMVSRPCRPTHIQVVGAMK